MFFLLIRIPVRKAITATLAPVRLQAKRGRQPRSNRPIDRVAFDLPKHWERDDIDAKACLLDGPTDDAGHRAVIQVEVMEGPDDAQHLYSELLKHQLQPGFTLIKGGVVDRDRGSQGAQLQYTCDVDGAPVAVQELAFPVGFRSVAHAQAICPLHMVPAHGAGISAFFGSLRPSRRLELPGALRAGM